jgi:hypothetical protein
MRCMPILQVAAGVAVAGATWAASDLISAARVHPPFRGVVPSRSDVVFSTRFTRPEALPVIKAFGATRVEWVYTKDAGFAARLEQQVPWFGGAINANGPLPNDAGYARDFDGKVLSAPWMPGWGVFWVTTTHPDTQRVFEEQVRTYIDLGADSLQHDDPQLQFFAALRQGGDFNESTLRGFPTWLAQKADPTRVRQAGLKNFDGNYRDWLIEEHKVKGADDYKKRFQQFASTPLWLDYIRDTVVEHHKRVRALAASLKGRAVPLSMNLGGLYEPLEANPYMFLAPVADYSIAETQIKDLTLQVMQANTARALGLGFVPSLQPLSLPENRSAIAFLYALGAQPLVPWDVYDGNDEKGKAKRFFGSPEDYADLYTFVRANPSVFDGLETTPVVGIAVPVDREVTDALRKLSQRFVAQQVPFAFVPVGGVAGYRADPVRLKHLRLLVTLDSEADNYRAADLRALDASGVPRVTHTALKNEQIASLRPFQFAPGAERLRVVPRADPANPNRLVIHLVDTARGEKASSDADCRRRVGVRSELLGDATVASAQWLQPSGRSSVSPESSGGFVYFGLRGCSLWGVLDVWLKR